MAQTTTSPTSLDVLDGVNTTIASVLTTTQGMAGKIHKGNARIMAHNKAPSAHGISDATSPLRVSLTHIVAGSIAESTSVKDVQASIAKNAATLSEVEESQTGFLTAYTSLEATVSDREQTLADLNVGITGAVKNVSDLRTDVENGAYGGGSGSPVSLPTLSGPDRIGIGLSAEYTLFCIGSAIDGATIASFEVTFAGGTAQTVSAVNGMATATVTAPEGTAEGTALTLSVVAIDSSGFRSKEAAKEVTAIQYVVQAPSLTAPAPGAYVSPVSVAFVTSAFAVVGPTDTHAASRFKITSDADGAVIVYDSGRTTTDLATHTANLSAAKLTPGATYYAWAQHEGSSLGIGSWSNPVAIVAASVVTPQITSPSESAVISPSNITVTTTAFAVIGGIIDTHASTDWRITSDAAGETVIAEALASADLTSHVFASPAVTRGQAYYLWARHRGTACGAGAWTKVQVSIKATRHGEILYDTNGQPAAVITGSYASRGAEPWTIRGKQVWIAVALAAIRGVSLTWGLNSVSDNSTNTTDIPSIENPGTNWKLASNNTAADGSGPYVSTQSTESHMDASFTYSQAVKGSEGLTDAILAYNGSMQAAAYCRTITLADLGKMDLPSIDVIMRIYQSRTVIDSLDITVAANTAKKLSNWGFGSAYGVHVWSASEYNSTSAWIVHENGAPTSSGKHSQIGVVPALEIPA